MYWGSGSAPVSCHRDFAGMCIKLLKNEESIHMLKEGGLGAKALGAKGVRKSGFKSWLSC